MPTPSFRLAALLGALGPASLCAACIITTNGDDGNIASSDDGPPPPTGLTPNTTGPDTTTTSPTTTPADDTGTTGLDDTGDTTTGGPMGVCTDNLLGDPGFEAGTPNPSWDEASTVFGTPICDAACTTEEGAAPYAGDWWVWLGGVEDEPEQGSVSQVVTIEPEMAYVGFWLQIRSGAGTGDDVFTVTLDGDTIFMAVDTQMAEFGEYTQVYVDVTDWADGGAHELAFTGDVTGNGLTSFFVDETSLVSCVEPAATDTGMTGDSGSGSSGSTGAGSSSGSTGSTG
jgi:hypothetical protein